MATLSNAEIFRAAVEISQDRGLTTGPVGWHWELGGPVCLEGALMAAIGITHTYHLHRHPIYAALTDRLGGREAWSWFDRQPTTWVWQRKRRQKNVRTLLLDLAFDEDLKAAATPLTNVNTPAASSQEAILPTLKEAVPVG